MEQVKTILIMNIPTEIKQALLEQLGSFNTFKIIFGTDDKNTFDANLDLVITGDENDRVFLEYPVLKLSTTKTYRLGTLLLQITKMLKEPNLYLEDISLGAYVLKPKEKNIVYQDKTEIALTDREVAILSYLARYKNEEVGREQLLKNVWHYQKGIDTHTIETHVYRLRQKIEKAIDRTSLLLTGENGYLLNTQPDNK